jgi:hypothetical protein
MAKDGKPKSAKQPLPPPLAPEDRTVGQLIAETIRLYGRRFWPSLSLGLAPAALVIASVEAGNRLGLLFALSVMGTVAIAAAFAAACVIASGEPTDAKTYLRAVVTGVIAYLPVPYLFVLGVFWLAFVGLAVPVVVVERRTIATAFVRAFRLGRVDPVHAVGSLAALWITTFVTGWVMFVLLRTGSEQGARVAAGLTSLVLSPVVLLGGALLYYDQSARLRVRSLVRPERSRDAALPHALDAHRPGPADTPGEPGPAARGQP